MISTWAGGSQEKCNININWVLVSTKIISNTLLVWATWEQGHYSVQPEFVKAKWNKTGHCETRPLILGCFDLFYTVCLEKASSSSHVVYTLHVPTRPPLLFPTNYYLSTSCFTLSACLENTSHRFWASFTHIRLSERTEKNWHCTMSLHHQACSQGKEVAVRKEKERSIRKKCRQCLHLYSLGNNAIPLGQTQQGVIRLTLQSKTLRQSQEQRRSKLNMLNAHMNSKQPKRWRHNF